MAKQKNITIDEIRKDDSPEWIENLTFWIVHNRNKILTALSVMVVIFAIAAFVQRGREMNLAAASDTLFEANQKFESAISQHPWGSQDRQQVMAEVRALADDVLANYPDTPAAENALLIKGNAYYFEGEPLGITGNTEEAIAIYEEYLAEVRGEDTFKEGAALLALAYANENLYLLAGNNQSQALAALNAASEWYNELMDLENAGFMRYEAMVGLARINTFEGRRDQAIELLTQVLRERGEFPQPPPRDAEMRERLFFQLRNMSQQFSTANTARIMLTRLGVDTEELIEQIREERGETAE